MENGERFAYSAVVNTLGEASLAPFLPIILQLRGQSVSASGLLDTGAAVSVLPYSLGIELGAIWEEQTVPVQLTGNLASFEARALLAFASIGSLAPVRLIFAWTQAEDVPLILGQINFFLEFDVCFYRAQQAFEVRPKT